MLIELISEQSFNSSLILKSNYLFIDYKKDKDELQDHIMRKENGF